MLRAATVARRMDYLELFERRGHLVDDLLLVASKLPPERFTEAGPAAGPSLSNLFVTWLEEQRRAVHASLLDRPYAPLPLGPKAGVLDVSRAFGGFRLTLRDEVAALTDADFARQV